MPSAKLREPDAQFVRQVGEQRPFGARVVHRRDAAAADTSASACREQLQRVGELGQVAHVHRAGGRAERLPGGVLTRERTGVRRDHGAAAR